MFKVARKPSSDPAQERLRQQKAQWNKEVSAFINDLINAKKLMNGAPNKFHMQKSMIKDPIPADPATIIGALADDFQSLAQKANSIIESQIEYSKTRKKKQPKPTPGTAPESPSGAPDLTQQLAPGLRAASLEAQLIVEASNPLSRLLSRFRRPWFGDEARKNKYRNSLLKSALELDKELSKLETEIVGSSPESIFGAGRLLKKISDRLSFLSGSIGSFQEGEPKAVDEAQIREAQIVIDDYRRYASEVPNLAANLKTRFDDLFVSFLKGDPAEQTRLAPQILSSYKDLLTEAKMRNNNTTATTFDQLVRAPKPETQLETKGSLITKWLGKVKHKLSPFDKTSALRLDIYKLAGETRAVVDEMMNSLEKDLDVPGLQGFMNEINEKMGAMKSLMAPLLSIVKEKMMDPAFMERLKTQNVWGYDFDLQDPKLQQQLRQKLRQEQIRGLF